VKRGDLDCYSGREHAKAKHDLLRNYVERYVMILGVSEAPSLVFVDAFAGPWKSGAEDLSDTSFGISLEVLRGCAEALGARFKKRPKIRALWIEEEETAFAQLSAAAEKASDSRVQVTARRGRFQDSIEYIADFIGPSSYAFIFVDPKGYARLIEAEVLAPLLQLQRAELLINYMWDHIRYAFGRPNEAGHQRNLRALYGPESEELRRIEDPTERSARALAAYEGQLRAQCPSEGRGRLRVLSYPILDTRGEQHPKYYLVHTTHSAKGLATFAEQCDKTNVTQALIFQLAYVSRREDRLGSTDMFGDHVSPELPVAPPATGAWLNRLPTAGSVVRVDVNVWADLLEAGRCLPSALHEGARELIDAGHLVNDDAKGKRPKRPVNYEKAESVRRV